MSVRNLVEVERESRKQIKKEFGKILGGGMVAVMFGIGFSFMYVYEQHYKPSSVLDGYLSSPDVTIRFKRPTLKHDGQPYRFKFGLASSGVYMCPCCYQ